jgi:adenylate cyclase
MQVSAVERRLAAVLAADVVSYSRLLERDEAGTLARLKAHRQAFLEPLVAAHKGRVVKVMGDGALVEFPSAVEAVACAVEMQAGIAERERSVPEGERIRFRLGINVGDIILEDGDIYGDGVNIAARLQVLAEPGGICVSRNIYDEVRNKLAVAFEPMGDQKVKNITALIGVYRVRLDGVTMRPAHARRRWAARTACAMLALGLAGAGLWYGLWSPVAETDQRATEAADTPPIALPAEPTPRLSIVVLPFTNLSGDSDQDFFADGITDDVTTDLSRIDGSFVIARHTAFAYKGKAGSIDLRELGRDLGVRYLLEGSVRRAGSRVQINATLIDAATSGALWAEQFDGTRDDLPALQSELTGRIAATLRLELIEAEGRRLEREHSQDPEALDDAMRGWALLYRPYSRENHQEARRLFERAIAEDPNTVGALIGLAFVLQGRSDSPAEDRERAAGLLWRALDLEPNRASGHFVLGLVRRSQGRFQEAVDELQTAITFDRNYAQAYLQLGITLLLLGRSEEAIPLGEQAMHLSPHDPSIGENLWLIGSAHLLAGRLDEAIRMLERARSFSPRLWYVHLHLAAAYGLAQRFKEARQELAEHLRLRPEFNSLAAISSSMPQVNYPAYLEQCKRTLYIGLRRAGMPDV